MTSDYLYPRVTTIRIDVYPTGEPNTHATYASYVDPCTPLIRFSRTVPIRDNLSR
jgi:hypothetical protein